MSDSSFILHPSSFPAVLCLGEALVDLFPADPRQNLQQADLLAKRAGGAPANVAAGLAKLGIPSGFIGTVGDDHFGYYLRDTLAASGVDVRQMSFDTTTSTGVSFVWLTENGDGQFWYFKMVRADRMLSVDKIDWQIFDQAKVFHHCSVLLAAEPSRTASYTALDRARQNQQLISYDVNMRLPAWENRQAARAGLLQPMPYSDILKLNQHELKFLTGQDDLHAAVDALWHANFKLLVVTLGEQGCYYRTSAHDGFVSGYSVTVMDTVGAGDGFAAGLLAQILQPPDNDVFDFSSPEQVQSACRYANAVAALTTTRAGAMTALPDKEQVLSFEF